jgi:hypothetical protein
MRAAAKIRRVAMVGTKKSAHRHKSQPDHVDAKPKARLELTSGSAEENCIDPKLKAESGSAEAYCVDSKLKAGLELASGGVEENCIDPKLIAESGSAEENCVDFKPEAGLELASGSAEEISAPSGTRQAKVPGQRKLDVRQGLGDTADDDSGGSHSSDESFLMRPGAVRIPGSNSLPQEDDDRATFTFTHQEDDSNTVNSHPSLEAELATDADAVVGQALQHQAATLQSQQQDALQNQAANLQWQQQDALQNQAATLQWQQQDALQNQEATLQGQQRDALLAATLQWEQQDTSQNQAAALQWQRQDAVQNMESGRNDIEPIAPDGGIDSHPAASQRQQQDGAHQEVDSGRIGIEPIAAQPKLFGSVSRPSRRHAMCGFLAILVIAIVGFMLAVVLSCNNKVGILF